MHFISNLIEKHSSEFQNYSILTLKTIVFIFVGWWAINKISKISTIFLKKACSDEGIASFLGSVIKFSLRIFLIVIVMTFFGFNVNSIIAAVGASVLAVGISLKESLSNMASGVVLVINKPIHVGDFIEIESFSGTVLKIEMFFTTLKTLEKNQTIIIPNTKLMSAIVIRKSEYDISNIDMSYMVSCDTYNKDISKFLNKEFVLNNKILQIPSPEINFEKANELETNVKIRIWVQKRHEKEVKNDLKKIFFKIKSKYNIDFKK